MSTTDTPFPADWAIEEALKAFNDRPSRPGLLATVLDVKGQSYVGWAATLIAYARLIEECKPELRPLDANGAMQRAITVIWKDRQRSGAWYGSIQYAQQMLDKLAEQGFAVVRKESAQ